MSSAASGQPAAVWLSGRRWLRIRYTWNMNLPEYEELEHTADWALRVTGRDLASLLENAAWGMLELAGAEPGDGAGVERLVSLEAMDREALLVAWLEELLFAIETREVTFQELEVVVTDGWRIQARLLEVPLGRLSKHIKAVTFNELRVEEHDGGLASTIVFDV